MNMKYWESFLVEILHRNGSQNYIHGLSIKEYQNLKVKY
jgi:hypothetical protein